MEAAQPTAPQVHKPHHVLRWVFGLIAAAVIAVVAIGVVQELSQSGNGKSSQAAAKADHAYQRLDGTISRAAHMTNPAIQAEYGCLARASKSSPEGGPATAACAPLGDKAASQVKLASKQLDAAYKSSPAYLHRIYGDAVRTTQQSLAAAGEYVAALTAYARVHGATPYAGETEWDQMTAAQNRFDAAIKQQSKAVDAAGHDWYRYAKKRWGLEYK